MDTNFNFDAYRAELGVKISRYLHDDAFSSLNPRLLHKIESEAKILIPPRTIDKVGWEIWYMVFARVLNSMIQVGTIQISSLCGFESGIGITLRKFEKKSRL